MRFDEILERLAARERRIFHAGLLTGFLTCALIVVILELIRSGAAERVVLDYISWAQEQMQ